MTFYPFVSFFTLYKHILETSNYEEARADLSLTLYIGGALSRWSKVKHELQPLSTVFRALNEVCQRTLSVKFPLEHYSPGSNDITIELPSPEGMRITNYNKYDVLIECRFSEYQCGYRRADAKPSTVYAVARDGGV